VGSNEFLDVIVALLVTAAGAGLVASAVVARWPGHDPTAPRLRADSPVLQQHDGHRGRLRALWRTRMDPGVATGLALTLAVTALVVLTATAGILLLMVRAKTGVARYDLTLAEWGATHATPGSTAVVRRLSLLGGTAGVLAIAAVVGVLEYRRLPKRALPALLGLTVLGQFAVTNIIKAIVERARPDINQLTGFAGSSFPSGHAAAAATLFAVVALLVGRRRSRRARAAIAGCAVGVATMVAGTRVLLGVHWLTDVLAGLAIGWAWFVLCSLAFGGRLLDFGAPETAAAGATAAGNGQRTGTASA
jgi:membrane-associated phospholipid phosphatase